MRQEQGKSLFGITLLLVLFVLIIVVTVLYVLTSHSSLKESRVDGISDDVYVQLVEHFFAAKEINAIYDEYKENENQLDKTQLADQELYEQAESYAEEHDIYDVGKVFPNPLFFHYFKNREMKQNNCI